ncbi:MAG TPA: polysaccharide biosynthesis/export family protein [Phnomibacter sp.]|nr:polysaccharide biosynthesis/export family protein [Phnomibacter sp.]
MMTGYLDSTKTISLSKYPFAFSEPTIKKYDLVRVKFAGMSPTTTAMLNSYGGVHAETQMTATDGPAIEGQQVDKDGFMEFPLIGKVQAEGLTKAQLRDKLLAAVTPILKDPFIYVDLPKRGITILGEVKESSTVVFAKEHANLFETFAQVGYVTDLADLTKVKVYREEANGTRSIGHLNLQDTSFMSSPYFYPQPDDVIFVPARAEKFARNVGQTYVVFASLMLSLVTLILTLSN